jgi:transcriptional regulator with XRE-family HTH domain
MAAAVTVRVDGRVPAWTLGDRLRKARESAGLDQAELAAAIGVSKRSVGAAERGESTPRRHVLIAWAAATGVALGWLCPGEAAAAPRAPSRPGFRTAPITIMRGRCLRRPPGRRPGPRP